MDEATIRQNLQSTVPTTTPAVERVPDTTPLEGDPAFQSAVELGDSIHTQRFMDYYNIPAGSRYSPETAQHVQTIMQWAAKTSGSNDIVDIMRVISEQESSLGIRFRDDRFFKMYKYVRLDSERRRIATEMSTLYGG